MIMAAVLAHLSRLALGGSVIALLLGPARATEESLAHALRALAAQVSCRWNAAADLFEGVSMVRAELGRAPIVIRARRGDAAPGEGRLERRRT